LLATPMKLGALVATVFLRKILAGQKISIQGLKAERRARKKPA